MKLCPKCQSSKPLSEYYTRRDRNGQSHSWCKICLNAQAMERQRNLKQECVDYKGAKCEHCSYDKYIGALEFHHKDPNQKEFTIAKVNQTKFNDKIKLELDKCLLLCANCHREEHARISGLIY